MNYRIVSDSSSDLRTLEHADFCNVPLKIIAGDREFVDDASLDLDDMLTYLSSYKGKSGTACPSVGEWLDAFGDREYVFAVTITSNLSGSYSSAVQAKDIYEALHPGRHVCCLDTLSTGQEMALILEKLRELIAAGKDYATIETEIRDYMTHTHLLFSLEHLNNMARNGRVSPIIAQACNFLGIRIVGQASSEGTLQPLHKCRGEKKALKALFDEMKKSWKGGRVRVAHCKNETAARAILEMIREVKPDCDIVLREFAGLCSFYAEEGGVMVAFEDV